MTEQKLKGRVGITLIASHLAIIVLAVVLRLMNGFTGDEFTTLFAIVTPMFAGYTTAIVASLIAERHVKEDHSKEVTTAFVVITLLLPLVLAVIVAIAIWLKAYSLAFSDFEDFKRFLITIESIFAVYVGMLIYTLFPRQKAPSEAAKAAAPKKKRP